MLQKTGVRSLVENFVQHCQENPRGCNQLPHHYHCYCSSITSLVATKGVSLMRASRFPVNTPIHTRTDSITTRLTITTSTAVTPASNRLLKIMRAVALVAGPPANARACARKPIRGSGSNSLCHDAVNVIATKAESGAKVTRAYLIRCILTMIVVATHNATVASN